METKKIMEIVLGGVVMGLTVGIGINLSNRLMGKIGRKEDEVVVTTKSEMMGGKYNSKGLSDYARKCSDGATFTVQASNEAMADRMANHYCAKK